jgi:hypothetical protein
MPTRLGGYLFFDVAGPKPLPFPSVGALPAVTSGLRPLVQTTVFMSGVQLYKMVPGHRDGQNAVAVAFRFRPEIPDQSRPVLPFRPVLLRKKAALLRKIGAHARRQPCCQATPAVAVRSHRAPRAPPVFRSNAGLFGTMSLVSGPSRTRELIETNRCSFRHNAERDTCPSTWCHTSVGGPRDAI